MEYYSSTIEDFLKTANDNILGKLLINDTFETSDLQKNAWNQEIIILKDQLQSFSRGSLCFEFTIPRIGHRIDTVCIIDGIIFLLEFKVGDKEYKKSTDDQVMDYALDLKYFHEGSKTRFVIPINISTKAPYDEKPLTFMEDKISTVLHCNDNNIAQTVKRSLKTVNDTPLNMQEWSSSRYAPTPTIIEAAQALYRNHSVQDISRNDAGAQNLTRTTDAIRNIINTCKKEHKKAICFVTGVPGSGKTLAGLNIANECHKFDENEHAIFLSGNGPLVDVLQNALAADKAKREGITKKAAQRETKAFIQIIHKFRDEALSTNEPPIEKVAIFDEAQRAWDEKSLTNFMARKKRVPDFTQSEPEFMLNIMDRHKDWAVLICLVGGGQEIYTGEAGIQDWFRILKDKYGNWDIYLSDNMTGNEYIGNESISSLLHGREYNIEPSLHLGVSLRSFRSEKLSGFVKAVLDNKPAEASEIYNELNKSYPIVITRNFDKAKNWVKAKARGNERYGLLASSEGKRLREIGIWVPTKINHVGWFLNGKDNVDSSYYLEVAASEFVVQGLEIDYGLLAWDGDFRYSRGEFNHFKFRGTKWNNIKSDQDKKYLKNAYRVLLTRARQGLVIFIPEGNDEDATCKREYYDGTYTYLKDIGVTEI